MKAVFWVPALIGLSLFSFVHDAGAFRCSRTGSDFGASLIWEERRIEYFVDSDMGRDITDDRAELQAIRDSFTAWNRPDCSDLELVFAGTADDLTAGSNANGPNRNVVVFLADSWPYERSVIAVTTNAYNPKTGVVFDADIELNDQSFTFVIAEEGCTARPGNMDLQNTLTHEVGHVIGLDHPPASPQNEGVTMFASAPPCETQKRTLEDDDIEGLCTIYPAGKPNQQCFTPEEPSFLVVEEDDGFGGCSCRSRGRGGSAAIFFLAMALLLGRGIFRRILRDRDRAM